ncbi:MAG: peptidase M48 [Bdellovibrionaceae bacterium]|nr:peptidase M48 [Pseudobdellovibrionaceae bacterium]|tara:strand:- start:7015 stop:8259 length:1245 start_codon:yes stop_codon:yes gene_type:complete
MVLQMTLNLNTVIGLFIGWHLFEMGISILSYLNEKKPLPKTLNHLLNQTERQKSLNYQKDRLIFGLFSQAFTLTLLVVCLKLFFFVFLWEKISFINQVTFRSTIYVLILLFLSDLIMIPFSYVSQFKIEKKYDFNRMTHRTFILDFLKGNLLKIVIGTPILYGLFSFYENFSSQAWWYAWLFITVVQILLIYLVPTWIMPLFNKYESVKDEKLKEEIEAFAEKENFTLSGLFQMDGSKRSSKANAFLTGFGKNKRIVLFDTLIDSLNHEQILAVLAHEMGHFKRKHIFKGLILSTATLGITLFVFSKIAQSPWIFKITGFTETPPSLGLILTLLLFSPLSVPLSIVSNLFSRKFEFEADEYSFKSFPKPNALIEGLQSLSKNHLSALQPHPLKVFLEYSHPPLSERIRAIQDLK